MCRTLVRSPRSRPAHVVHAALAQADERQHPEDGRARQGERRALGEVARRQLRVARQPVHLRLVHEEVERVEPAQRAIRVGAIQLCLDALRLELVDALLRPRPQLDDRAELYRVRGTRLRARGLEPHLEPVVAEGALLRGARHRVDVDDTERAGGDARAAAVADVGLDHHRVELGADDGAGRTHFQAPCLDAVLAHVAHHQPAAVVRTLELLDEADVPPVDAVEPAGVVVAVPGELPDPAVRGGELVPFLARDLARLAADANRGVGEESHGLRHITPSPRCRRTPCLRGSTRWGRSTKARRSSATWRRRDMAQPMGFFTDTTVCIGCKACEVACKEWNQLPAANGGIGELSGDSYDNTRRLDGIHWRHVRFIEQFKGPYDGRWLMMSDVCKHCVQAGCLEVCPTGAIIRTEFDTVVIQSDVCNGCRACIAACPFGVIDVNPVSGTAQKCTLCYDRLKVGLEPACSKACPTDSIQFGSIVELRTRAHKRVDQLKAQGVKAELYGADPDGALGGLNSFYLLVDEPEVYGLPRKPTLPSRNLTKSAP